MVVDSALMQQITLNNQPSPRLVDLKRLHLWLTDVWHGGSELRGPGSDIWFSTINGRCKREDLISIWPRQHSSDPFTMLFFNLSHLWVRLLPRIPLVKVKVQLHTKGLLVP